MSREQKVLLLILRLALGWLFFYAGVTKIVNPEWTAKGYLEHASSFSFLYSWLATPAMLSFVNFINEWGLTLLGVSLILGVLVRVSTILGAALMLLYYLPILKFPYVGDHSYLVDEHIIYVLVLLYLYSVNAGKYFGLDKFFRRSS